MAKEYDVIVIGSGAGMNVASNALEAGLEVALFEHGAMGGTCLNNGCIPTKILVHPADVVRSLQDAGEVGIRGRVESVDFPLIMRRMRDMVDPGREGMERSVSRAKGLTWYRDTAEFVGDYTVRSGKDEATARRIVIASGSRPTVPNIPGLAEAGFLDNVSVLRLERLPRSILMLGGGYVACEYGHFFSALGVDTTVIEMAPTLLGAEDAEVSSLFTKVFSKYVKTHTGHQAVRVEREGGFKVIVAKNLKDGKEYRFRAEEIMLAVGRRSNADLLKPEKTGVAVDAKGWIKVDDHLQTNKLGIYALGDALGFHMFRHTANYESQVVWVNGFTNSRMKADFHAVPHAVFSWPTVAGVGMTEAQAKAAGHELLLGRASYHDVAMGYAMAARDTMFKAVVDAKTRKILGAHAVGPEAPELVQQVTYLMNAGRRDYTPLWESQVIHPALSEVVLRAFGNMVPEEHYHGHSHSHAGHNH